MKFKLMTLVFGVVLTMPAVACWNDSECPNDKVCECQSTSPTGNCSSAGQCVSDGRDWKTLKLELLKENNSVAVTKLNVDDVKKAGNTIEPVTMKIEGLTGDPKIQYFSQKVNGNIVKIFGLECKPSIGGSVRVSGVGTDIALVEVNASGVPGGRFSSNCTFQVLH